MFKDRKDAGVKLALELKRILKENDYEIVGIARGGVVLAKIIADYFNASLDILVIKKIGAPYNRELAIGAVGPERIVYWDEDLIKKLKIGKSYRIRILEEKAQEAESLGKMFDINKKGLDFKDKRVILVDDGVATGATVLCGQKIIKAQKPKELILATPVISRESFEDIKDFFDKIVALKIADAFSAVGQFYKHFPQVGNEEVKRLL